MAHFYGTIQGQHGQTSRLGNKTSGLKMLAASRQGDALIELYHDNGTDFIRVSLVPHDGQGTTQMLYNGPISGAKKD